MGPNFITKDITLTCYYLIVTFIQKIKNLKTQIQKGEMPLKKRECSNIMWTELGDTNHPGGDGSHSAIMFKYFTSEYGCFSAALKNKKMHCKMKQDKAYNGPHKYFLLKVMNKR